MKTVICIPTYNEIDNITDMVTSIRQETGGISPDILVIDSASPDGTAEAVVVLQKNDPNLFLFRQSQKLGLGKAYLDGMRWALEKKYDFVITMDADFSHHPKYIPQLIKSIEDKDLVIGSRYVKGGSLENWSFPRRCLSSFANWYARTLTGLPFSDLTSGFHCFRTSLLSKVLRYPIRAEGYAFLVELKFLSIMQRARYGEIPIAVHDRIRGDSKISKRVILESVLFVLNCSLKRHRVLKILRSMELAQASGKQ